MVTMFRDLIARIFGSDEVEMRFVTPSPPLAPPPPAETAPATLPVEASSSPGEAAERRGAGTLVLRPAPRAE
jgi:hypothetical protein